MLFRLIIWTIIFYFIFKFIRRIINVFLLQNSRRGSTSDNNIHGSSVNPNGQAQARNHYNISQKDIVDAEFEDIKPEEEEKKDKDNTGKE
ncbi:MAG: hypothetical protein ACM3UR_00260 [Bacteroidota bacterium]|jgi:hypothetical protein|nr:hypothetical protein [Ignavibacteria bacterium]HEX2963032.1 hypothetical protein [Ignavibacteriales bacterium]MCU7499783.1 hypothetical protein [Ignavibacteria bacterium]MCU7513166.1 hypothetical protein [Ignavibacteria bacterium]MCU7522054.1 hypothetical protein [Ignavibacteria bacterium]